MGSEMCIRDSPITSVHKKCYWPKFPTKSCHKTFTFSQLSAPIKSVLTIKTNLSAELKRFIGEMKRLPVPGYESWYASYECDATDCIAGEMIKYR